MKTYINQLVTMFFLLITINSFSQIVLVVEQPGTIINKKYTAGNFISIKTINNLRLSGHINHITDSTIVINYITIKTSEIKYVYTSRWLVSTVSRLGIEGGVAYIMVDTFNGLLNNDKPILRNNAIKIGSIMFGSGLVLKLFSHKRLHINNKAWRIKVLDFSILKDPGVYEQLKKNDTEIH